VKSPAVIWIVDIKFCEGESVGTFNIAERIGQLFLSMLGAFPIEHGHFVGQVGTTSFERHDQRSIKPARTLFGSCIRSDPLCSGCQPKRWLCHDPRRRHWNNLNRSRYQRENDADRALDADCFVTLNRLTTLIGNTRLSWKFVSFWILVFFKVFFLFFSFAFCFAPLLLA